MVKIAILGAGINGVSCALRIKEKYADTEVVLISKEFTPNTTGDGSGGLWYPYLCANTPRHLIAKWGLETFKYILHLWRQGELGVSLIPVLVLYTETRDATVPTWAPHVFGYHNLSEKQLEYFGRLHNHTFISGHIFTTFVVPPPKLISHFYHRFSKAGGKVFSGTVTSLRDKILDQYDVIVNCTGLGSLEMVPDKLMTPVRGQITKVKAPWLTSVLVSYDIGHYIIPNDETVVLGGTHQSGDFNRNEDPDDDKFIIDGCHRLIPSLINAEKVKTWVGLRPSRNEIRIDKEFSDGKLIIHNYGHGAGINGVSCALRIKEKYADTEVVLISKEFTPNTTGDGSGGLWYPYLCANTPRHLIAKWGLETFKYILHLWRQGELGVSLIPVLVLYTETRDATVPTWAPHVFGYHNLSEKQLEYFGRLHNHTFISGHIFTTFVVPPPKLISHFYHRFSKAGGKVFSGTVTSLRDKILDQYDVIVNCTGLGSLEMVPDKLMTPVRGQITKVKAPWLTSVLVSYDIGHYIIPNDETVVLGGTHQSGDFNRNEDPDDDKFIIDGCHRLIPSLINAEKLKTWVGLRPSRNEIRIDKEFSDGKLIIHNYGHGGSGLTLFWGCSTEVLSLLQPRMNETIHEKSKL